MIQILGHGQVIQCFTKVHALDVFMALTAVMMKLSTNETETIYFRNSLKETDRLPAILQIVSLLPPGMEETQGGEFTF